ncbi:MAG: PqqD family protein [Bacteroidales bacterium]|nr:PqqD family protein [Bacteroidales bacterium]
MKIKEGFVLRTICGQNVISGEGSANVNYSSLISLNETAAYLFKELQGKEFTEETATELLLDQYDVDRETAEKDVKTLFAKWVEIGLAE